MYRGGERGFFIVNLLVQIHLIIEMILVDRPCAMEFEITFPGSLIYTFLNRGRIQSKLDMCLREGRWVVKVAIKTEAGAVQETGGVRTGTVTDLSRFCTGNLRIYFTASKQFRGQTPERGLRINKHAFPPLRG